MARAVFRQEKLEFKARLGLHSEILCSKGGKERRGKEGKGEERTEKEGREEEGRGGKGREGDKEGRGKLFGSGSKC